MSSEQGHGVAVETDIILATLESTRVPRHALEVLWDNTLADMETRPSTLPSTKSTNGSAGLLSRACAGACWPATTSSSAPSIR